MKKALIIVGLLLVVPYVLGNITARVLEVLSPPPALPLIASLQHTRALTRITLGVVAVYYAGLIGGWVVLRRKKR